MLALQIQQHPLKLLVDFLSISVKQQVCLSVANSPVVKNDSKMNDRVQDSLYDFIYVLSAQ
jgi:hypothetical protein